MGNFKDELLLAQGSDKDRLKFYKRFYDNFDCRFIPRTEGIAELEVILPKEAKTIEELVEQLENAGINLQKKGGEIPEAYIDHFEIFTDDKIDEVTLYKEAIISKLSEPEWNARPNYKLFEKNNLSSIRINVSIYNPKI